jgi:hypothetical protein
MYTLKNVETNTSEKFATVEELVNHVNLMAVENLGEDYSVACLTEADYYINLHTDLILVKDSEVVEFLKEFATKVMEIETSDYVEIMMDDHRCIEFDGVQYYLSTTSFLDSRIEELREKLYHNFQYIG